MPINPARWSADRLRRLSFALLFFVVFSVAWSISFFVIFSTAFTLMTLVLVARERQWRGLGRVLLCLGALYFFFTVLSLTQSDYLKETLRGVLKVLRHLLLCFSVVCVVDSRERFRKIFLWVLAVACIISLDAVFQGLTGVELLRGRSMIPYEGVSRLTGPFHHANDYSAYLTIVVLAFFGALGGARTAFSKKESLLLSLGFLLCLGALLATYTRGAWIACLLSGLLLGLALRSRGLLFFLGAALLGGFLFAPGFIRERALTLFDLTNNTIKERRELWSESLSLIRRSPWLGLGANTYAKNEIRFKPADSTADHMYSHNGYLQMAAEIGILGLLSFLAVVGYILFAGFSAFARAPDPFLKVSGFGLGFGMVAFLLHSGTDTNLHSVLLINFFWLTAGLVWAARNCLSR